MVRIRCNDVDTFKRFKCNLAHIQLYESYVENDKINGRRKSFGVIVDETHSD